MRRRAFVAGIAGSAFAWPLAVHAQQPSMTLVGLLLSNQLDDRHIGAVRQGLADAGYTEGRNLAIKYRSADGRFDRLPAIATQLVADPVAAIVAFSPAAALAAKAASSTTPIVFAIGADPVDLGLVASLNRPGGNVTGVTFFVNTLGAKRLELLRALVPSAIVIGFLVNARNPTSQSQTADVQAAARAHGVKLVFLDAGSEREIDAAFTSLVNQRANAIIVGADSFFLSRRDQLVGLAARHALPAMYYLREFVEIGGLISYGR
jgi:putative tryptophan/tyrosine transport system substrate-binding protein